MSDDPEFLARPALAVDVVEQGSGPRDGSIPCVVGRNIRFSSEVLTSFALRDFNPLVYDALLLTAAVEFCDRSLARHTRQWGREFNLRLPVHDIAHWSNPRVGNSLASTLNLLTGDAWTVTFVGRDRPAERPAQESLQFGRCSEAVIAFSNGMDSRAVAALEQAKRGEALVLVRLGSPGRRLAKRRSKQPFLGVPYEVRLNRRDNAENSARTRGFKFALISALAAYLVGAASVLVPESGQGALAPAWLPVGQGYADYRNHLIFTRRMEEFVRALLGYSLRYDFPRIWKTKGETLREFVTLVGDDGTWAATRSCWQQPRQTALEGTWRQCGVCAACVLRRLSVHAAGLTEPRSNYVWENLAASSFEAGAHPAFPPHRITPAMHQYAIAGVLHFDQLAGLAKSAQYRLLMERERHQLSHALGLEPEKTGAHMDRLLDQHGREWSAFVASWGERSFLGQWIGAPQ